MTHANEVIDRRLAREVLAVRLEFNSARAETVREYLVMLLTAVWRQGEGFSGKRPFGNSGWEWDLFGPLVKAGLIVGTFDGDGFLDACDEQRGNALIAAAIAELGEVQS
jgi:hypothetical protein